MRKLLAISAGMLLALSACSSASRSTAAADDSATSTTNVLTLPQLQPNADSLMAHVHLQTDFGARVPGTPAHAKAVDAMVKKLHALGADAVEVHQAPVTTYDGTQLTAHNIFASFNPQAAQKMLLLAHYDCRPWADQDPDPARRTQPVPGANDGASGVAVIFEALRTALPQLPDSLGVDVLLTDVEDWGNSGVGDNESWCLGSQAWALDMPYAADAKPRFAVLLDMVGGRNAVFHREALSQRYAPRVVNFVWRMAKAAGQEKRFIDKIGGTIIDDHIPLLRVGIPAIDIVESINPETQSFAPTWHTTDDTAENLDAATMAAVTQVVATTILNQNKL